MSEMNGHDELTEEQALEMRDLVRVAAREATAKSIEVIEAVSPDDSAPFEQQTHTLMIESVDRITQQWVEQLASVRDNTKTIEQLVIETATTLKHQITQLHLLGVQAMKEAERGQQVNRNLAAELNRMMERSRAA